MKIFINLPTWLGDSVMASAALGFVFHFLIILIKMGKVLARAKGSGKFGTKSNTQQNNNINSSQRN